MNLRLIIWKTTWRSFIIGIGYLLTIFTTGFISKFFGISLPSDTESNLIIIWLLVAGFLLGLFLGPISSYLQVSRWRQFIILGAVIFFNMGSVAIEGAFYSPDLVHIPLPYLFIQQLLASIAAAALITVLFASHRKAVSFIELLSTRHWFSWVWRFIVCCLCYLILYFIFGAINYNLVTEPYYTSHVGSLTVPPPSVIFMVESIRAPLIILSVAFFALSFQSPLKQLILITGLTLFWVGGFVPLFLQVNALPLALLVASGVEIFFQNFLTGMVVALLLRGSLLSSTTSSSGS